MATAKDGQRLHEGPTGVIPSQRADGEIPWRRAYTRKLPSHTPGVRHLGRREPTTDARADKEANHGRRWQGSKAASSEFRDDDNKGVWVRSKEEQEAEMKKAMYRSVGAVEWFPTEPNEGLKGKRGSIPCTICGNGNAPTA